MSDAPQAESPDHWNEKVHQVVEGAEVLNTVKDAAELVGLPRPQARRAVASTTLLVWAVASPIIALLAGLYSLLKADSTEENLAGARGFAYGLIWGVLGKGTPTATCGGPNELFPDNVKLEQANWDKGAREGAAKGQEQAFKNRCLIWMAKNHDDNGDHLVREFFKDAASHLDLPPAP